MTPQLNLCKLGLCWLFLLSIHRRVVAQLEHRSLRLGELRTSKASLKVSKSDRERGWPQWFPIKRDNATATKESPAQKDETPKKKRSFAFRRRKGDESPTGEVVPDVPKKERKESPPPTDISPATGQTGGTEKPTESRKEGTKKKVAQSLDKSVHTLCRFFVAIVALKDLILADCGK